VWEVHQDLMSEHWTQFQPAKKKQASQRNSFQFFQQDTTLLPENIITCIFKNSLPVGQPSCLPNFLASDIEPKINTETVGNGTEEN